MRPCGTLAAYRRHLRHDEDPCDVCRQANAAADKPRRERGRKRDRKIPDLHIDRREIRNGVPWKPYVYRGSG